MSLLTRTLKLSPVLMVGDDVYGVKRSVARGLDEEQGGNHLLTLESRKKLETPAMAARRRRTYGPFFVPDVRKMARILGFNPATGAVTPAMWDAMAKRGYPDAFAISLMNSYIAAHPQTSLVFPIPQGEMGRVCQGLHRTAGDDSFAQNWAIDICCPDHTTVVAAEAGIVTKLSGHNPNQDTWDTQGVFGWSIHFETAAGYHYYITHLGSRQVTHVGQRFQAGDTLGKVGDQHFRPDHVHYGVTSPHGAADAKKRILAVSKAPRID